MNVREQFKPTPMAANASQVVGGSQMAGFLCVVSGTLTVTANNSQGVSTVFVDAVPVTAGIYTPIPLNFSTPAGGVVSLAGGAKGTLFT